MTGVGVVPKAYPGEQFSQCEWWSTMSGFLAMIFIFVLVSIVLGVTRSNRPSLGDGGYPPQQLGPRHAGTLEVVQWDDRLEGVDAGVGHVVTTGCRLLSLSAAR